MKRSTKYVALDVHQATTVASVREESGRVIARSVLETHGPSILEYLRGMRGAIHVAFEEGTQSQWLHDLVAPLVDRVIVCDPCQLARQGNKGDHVDADRLAELLRLGGLRPVYHGSADRADLQELSRSYRSLVEDGTRVMLRLKALFRARAIRTSGTAVYHPAGRAEWLAQLPERGVRFRTEALYAELDVLRAILFLGPVRVALLLATMGTPWRFRTKRNLWAYAGLAVVTRSSADYMIIAGQPVRRHRAPLTRGLNRNHNHVLKDVFKGGHRRHGEAGAPAGLLSRPDRAGDAGGAGPGDGDPQARLAHAAAVEERRVLRSGEVDDAIALTADPRGGGAGAVPSPTAPGSGTTVRGAVSSSPFARPALMPRHSPDPRPLRRTRRSVRPAACRVSDRTMVRVVRPERLPVVQIGSGVESR